MTLPRPLAATFLIVGALSCDDSTPAPQPVSTPTLLRFSADTTAPFAFNSGFTTPATLVIRTQDDWAEAWATVHDGLTPLPAMPEVDFNREMVMLIAAGEQPDGGHTIVFTSMSRDSTGKLVAHAVHRAAGEGCMTPQVITQPVDLARTAWDSTDVIFEVRRETVACSQ